jgi:hypothetical protein
MNLYDQISWGVTAYAVKLRKIYCMGPTNSDMAFDRPATKTRTNSVGQSEVVPINVPSIDYAVSSDYPAFNFGSTDNVTTLAVVSSLVGQSEGTFFSDFVATADGLDKIILESNNGTTTHRIVLRMSSTNAIVFDVVVGNVLQGRITFVGPFITGTRYKCAGVYRNGYMAMFINGVKIGQALTPDMTGASLSTIGFKTSSGTAHFRGYKHADFIYKIAITDDQALLLTQ